MASIFVSHRCADTSQATRLASELKAAGHSVWLDEWNIGPGDSIVERIDRGLESVEYMVLCLSTAGVSTPWISREWMSTLARQLNGANIRLLPVVLSGGPLLAVLADIKYVDLTTDWNGGVV